jgi:A/G-specific adenine glycosylase
MKSKIEEKREFFVSEILRWYEKNGEFYPWRTEKDPFKILLSEILLRKTDRKKVAVVYPKISEYFGSPIKIVNTDIEKLEEFLKPLGLYKERALQLKQGAEFILNKFDGRIPENLNDLLKIPGVGKYTANAVLCFAYKKNVPLIDANLIRILKRFFNLTPNKSRERDDPMFWKFINDTIPTDNIKEFYYGILDFSNQICRPKNPKCAECPLITFCSYYKMHRKFRD